MRSKEKDSLFSNLVISIVARMQRITHDSHVDRGVPSRREAHLSSVLISRIADVVKVVLRTHNVRRPSSE